MPSHFPWSPVISCERKLFVKENPDRKKKKQNMCLFSKHNLFHAATRLLHPVRSFFNWDSLHATYYEAWSYKKKKHKKIKVYRKYVQKEPSVKRCLLIQDLKPLRS